MTDGESTGRASRSEGGRVLTGLREAAEWVAVLLPAGVVLACMWAAAAFARVYRDMEMPLPAPAILALNWASFTSKYWFFLLPVLLVCTVGVHAALRFTGARRPGTVLACVWAVTAVVAGVVVLLGLSMPMLLASR